MSYPTANAFLENAAGGNCWHGVVWDLSGFCMLAFRQQDNVRYAPMYIHRFPIPKKLSGCKCYEEIPDVPDRLRRCRCSRGLLQAEVAERVGLTYSAYKNLEAGTMQHLPRNVAQRLARFYNIPIEDLLDAYNQFLYDGQAERIRAYRESFGMGKKPFARKMGIPVRCLQEWESGRKVISIKCWERHFKGRA